MRYSESPGPKGPRGGGPFGPGHRHRLLISCILKSAPELLSTPKTLISKSAASCAPQHASQAALRPAWVGPVVVRPRMCLDFDGSELAGFGARPVPETRASVLAAGRNRNVKGRELQSQTLPHPHFFGNDTSHRDASDPADPKIARCRATGAVQRRSKWRVQRPLTTGVQRVRAESL